MRAEPHTARVAGSADPVRGWLYRFASARPEILVASSTGSAGDDEAVATLRSCAIELDARIHTAARPVATSIRYGIDTAVEGCIASRMFVTGRCTISAPITVTSPARHPSIDLDQPRPGDPARQPRRLTDRQLTLTA